MNFILLPNVTPQLGHVLIYSLKAIYDHSSQQRKGVFPSSPDTYRYNVYVRDEQSQSFTVRPI